MSALQQRRTAADFETHLIRQSKCGKSKIAHMITPRPVCMSHASDDGTVGLLAREDALRFLTRALRDRERLLINHSLPFDLAVAAAEKPELLPLVFVSYAEGRARDIVVRQQLVDIAEGESEFRRRRIGDKVVAMKAELGLDDLVRLYLGRKIKKGADTFRLRYADLDGLPVSEYPEDAKQYALGDAIEALDVFDAQERFFDGDELPDELPQQRAAWALQLMSAWGVRTDPIAVAHLKSELIAERTAALAHLNGCEWNGGAWVQTRPPSGIVKPDGSRDMKKIYERVIAALGVDTPMTPGGSRDPVPRTNEETLISTGDPDLIVLAKSMKGAKVLSTYVPALEAGTTQPICADWNVLVDTGRTSCSKPNLQNPPRAGGVRGCFVARPGNVFVGGDFDTIELRALGQVLLDCGIDSSMVEALHEGVDLHLALAAELLNIEYFDALQLYRNGDVEVDEMRQLCKIANFGFPGGMAADTFVEYAAGYEINGKPVVISRERAADLRLAWRRRWREMGRYFDYISACVKGLGEGTIRQKRSGRIRGGVTFTSCANGFFQGLAADGAKWALWCVTVECYLGICTSCQQSGDPTGVLSLDVERTRRSGCADCGGSGKSALYGSRPWLFMHDEIQLETPEALAAAAAERLAALMIRCMKYYLPDVPVGVSPVITRRWVKGAKPVRVNGQLVPSKLHKTPDGRKTWVHDERRAA